MKKYYCDICGEEIKGVDIPDSCNIFYITITGNQHFITTKTIGGEGKEIKSHIQNVTLRFHIHHGCLKKLTSSSDEDNKLHIPQKP